MKALRIPTDNQISLPLPEVAHLDAECPWCFGSGQRMFNPCGDCDGLGLVSADVLSRDRREFFDWVGAWSRAR